MKGLGDWWNGTDICCELQFTLGPSLQLQFPLAQQRGERAFEFGHGFALSWRFMLPVALAGANLGSTEPQSKRELFLTCEIELYEQANFFAPGQLNVPASPCRCA